MTVVDVLVVCSPARAASLTAALRAFPDLHVVEVVTLPGRAPRAAVQLGRGVLLLDAGVEGGAAALVHAVMASAPVPILVLAPGMAKAGADELLRAGAVEVRTREGLDGLTERCTVLAGVGVVRRAGVRPVPAPAWSSSPTGRGLAVGASTGGPPPLASLLHRPRGGRGPGLVVA